MSPDLTPFGFTPTESAGYGILLELGPSSGYAVAKALGIARANGYQALDGLVGKGAATCDEQRPKRYRAVKPGDLLATIAAREAAQLERLEDELAGRPAEGPARLVPVVGRRAVQEVATRSVVRAAGMVDCVAPRAFLEALTPAWRARRRAGGDTRLWSNDSPGGAIAEFSVEDASSPPPGVELPERVVLLSTPDGGLVGTFGDQPSGFWTSDPLMAALMRGTIAWITHLTSINQPVD